MNLFFSRKIKVSLVIACAFLFFYGFGTIVKSDKGDPFLTLCENADAYYIYTKTEASYEKFWSGHQRTVSVNNKLVVNNAAGVDEYAFLNLNEHVSNNIVRIKVRTLKANGAIIELDSSLVFKRNYSRKKIAAINYPIPAVEPGDTIESSITYTEPLRDSELGNYINLFSELPTKSSKYSLKIGEGIKVRYKPYNGFPEPKIISSDTLAHLQFSMNEVKGLEEKDDNCLPCELPYLYYSLEGIDEAPRTWKDVYNEEFNVLTQPFAVDYENSSYYKRWIRRVIGTAKDSSRYHKFNLVHAEVLNNFKIEQAKSSELIKSNGYFLKEQKFDPISIRRFYRQVLEDFEIDYWAVFGKNRRSGPIDTKYIRKGEFDHVFFAFANDKDVVKFIYPHDESFMFQMDEIPTSIYSTPAVFVKPYLTKKKRRKDKFISRDFEMAVVDSVLVDVAELPGMNVNLNYMNQMISCDVNPENKTNPIKYRFRVSGGLSTELRAFYEMLDKDEEASDFYDALSEFEGEDNTIEIDTVTNINLSNSKPYAYSMMAEGKLNDAITFINDSLVSVSLEKLINPIQIDSDSDTTELNYYLDYSYSDLYMFYINFPSTIEILGLENSTIDFKNEFGEYFFELKKSKYNQLRLQSNYKVIKNVIPKENYNQLKLLNDEVKTARSKRLIIKLKRD